MVMNMEKIIEVTVGDLHDCIRASVEWYFNSLKKDGLGDTADIPLLINNLTDHLYGNITIALIGKEGKRKREGKLPIVCDSCTEWLIASGFNPEDDTTAEFMEVAENLGFMLGDHICDDVVLCVCSGHD